MAQASLELAATNNDTTDLQIATPMKQKQEFLQRKNANNGPAVELNSKNHCLHTALQIHFHTDQSERNDEQTHDQSERRSDEQTHDQSERRSDEQTDQSERKSDEQTDQSERSTDRLRDAAAAAKQAGRGETSHKISDKVMRKTLVLTEKALFVALCILFAGGSFSTLSTFVSAYPPGKYGNATVQLRAQDMIFKPGLVPDGFFYILCTSMTFTLSMAWLLIIVYSLNGTWSFSFKLTMLILESLTFASFALMANKLVPRFKISFSGSTNISSSWLLFFSDLAVIFLCAFLFLVRHCFSKVSTRINGRVVRGD